MTTIPSKLVLLDFDGVLNDNAHIRGTETKFPGVRLCRQPHTLVPSPAPGMGAMRTNTKYEYVVQTRPARMRNPVWADWSQPFKRHKDASDLAKRLINVPSNRGHDYYRVSRRIVPE